MGRNAEQGVVLINVLVILALTASVVFAMISLSDIAIARSQRFSDAGQGLALASAGEASAITALRRDLREAPETDHLQEPWAQTAQTEVQIDTGLFALEITDAQARFNLNSLPSGGAYGLQVLARITAKLGLDPGVAPRIAARLAQSAPLRRMEDLVTDAGLTVTEVDALADLTTVLPLRTDVNINTAPEALLAVLTDNPVQAQSLEGVRRRNGFLTPNDTLAAGVILPSGVGYTSSFYHVTVTVTVGDIRQSHSSLLQRRIAANGVPQVVVVARDAGRRP